MSEALKDLMERGTPAPPPHALQAPALVQAARRRRSRRRVALAAVGTACAALAAGTAYVVSGSEPETRLRYATAEPELGRVEGPASVRIGRDRRVAVVGTDVLARLGGGQPYVLLGLRLANGQTCLSLDSGDPSGGMQICPPPGSSVPAVLETTDGIGVSGLGPGGAPGGIKSLPVTFGVAPPGTRTVVLEPLQGSAIRVPARDGGEHYSHGAYFLATFELGSGGDVVALAADGSELARRTLATRPRTVDCDAYRDVTRSHLSRALAVGRAYARENPAFDDPRRLAPPRTGRANTAAGVKEMLTRNVAAPERMAPEERYEHRLAALVVLEAPECWQDASLTALARQFLDVSG